MRYRGGGASRRMLRRAPRCAATSTLRHARLSRRAHHFRSSVSPAPSCCICGGVTLLFWDPAIPPSTVCLGIDELGRHSKIRRAPEIFGLALRRTSAGVDE